jgi:hypothetical protein
MGETCTLADCPPGPFAFNGSLGFKTEYHLSYPNELGGGKFEYISTRWPDAYCMESGEVFWGGAATHEVRAALIVTPIDITAWVPAPPLEGS